MESRLFQKESMASSNTQFAGTLTYLFICNWLFGYVCSQSINVVTIAGTGVASSINGAATVATFNNPFGLVMDSPGDLYVPNTMVIGFERFQRHLAWLR